MQRNTSLAQWLGDLLSIQGQVLSSIHKSIGLPALLLALEMAESRFETSTPFQSQLGSLRAWLTRHSSVWSEPAKPGAASPFEWIETSVEELDLREEIENYLWNYPPYRIAVEGGLDLEKSLPHGPQTLRLQQEWRHQCAELGIAWFTLLALPQAAQQTLQPRVLALWQAFDAG